jgi:two-component system sensor histidine kinase SenX3
VILAAALGLVAVGLATAVIVLALRVRQLERVMGESALRLDPSIAESGEELARALPRAVSRSRERTRRAASDLVQMREALRAIPQGVVIWAADGSVLFRNAVAEGYAGARHGDALVEAAIDELAADAVHGVPGSRTLDLFGPPRRTLVVTAIPIAGASGAANGALAVIEDVSERRRLDAVRRDFVANISHELRTPVGALGLLAETILGEEDRDVRGRLAQRMLSETDRVARTIEDLLTLSRIESEELPEREPVGAGLLMAEAVDRIRPAAEHRQITVQVDDPGDRLAIFGDRRQLVSALYNLLDNAVKYSDAGQVVEVSARTDGVNVDLMVRDHGIGIPQADVARIFERFYRVDQGRSRQTGGTGLGLAIVRHVATNHEGDVLVESVLGEGSTFTLRLPTGSTGPVALPNAEAS